MNISQPSKSPAQSSGCVDDPNWHGKFNADHTCAHIAHEPVSRCGWQSTDGTKAFDACPVACSTCGSVETTQVPTKLPSQSPTSKVSRMNCKNTTLNLLFAADGTQLATHIMVLQSWRSMLSFGAIIIR